MYNLVFRHIFIPICTHQNIRNDVDLHLHLSPFTLHSSLFNAAFLLHAIYFIHYCFPCKMFHTSSIIQICDSFLKVYLKKQWMILQCSGSTSCMLTLPIHTIPTYQIGATFYIFNIDVQSVRLSVWGVVVILIHRD